MHRFNLVFSLLLFAISSAVATEPADKTDTPSRASSKAASALTLVVMDPLSKPLSCDCVRGYAQREYTLLADHLQKSLGRPVNVVWFESLSDALDETGGKADLVIGKHSVVQMQGKQAELSLRPVARLTDGEGEVTQHGLIVVRQDDSAKQIADLSGYRVFFGDASAEEKAAAAEQVIQAAGVSVPEDRERFGACSVAAVKLVELPDDVKAAAVISSYAEPLLSGCGSIKPDDLRILGRTKEVPFVTAFVSESLADADRSAIADALMTAGEQPEILVGLETLAGFIEWTEPEKTKVDGPDWNQFRGSMRGSVIPWLPARLPDWQAATCWTVNDARPGLGGVMVAAGRVVIGGRNLSDTHDVFEAFDQASGERLWMYEAEARSDLDYGNTPRSTPAFSDGVIVTCGAMGLVSGLDASTGIPLWTRHMTRDFGASLPIWGFSGSPLIIDDKVIITPGAADASVVALDLFTGDTVWQSSGAEAVYASTLAIVSPQDSDVPPQDSDSAKAIISVDRLHAALRSASDGKVLARFQGHELEDFGVPSPVLGPSGDHVFLTSESLGIQRFSILPSTESFSQAAATNQRFRPDSHTPVCVDGRLLVASDGLSSLRCDDLSVSWTIEHESLFRYASIIATGKRALVTCEDGRVLLVKHSSDQGRIVDQWKLPVERLLSHPAIVGDRLYLRFGQQLRCISL